MIRDHKKPIKLNPSKLSDAYIKYRKEIIKTFWEEDKIIGKELLKESRGRIQKDSSLSEKEKEKLLREIDDYIDVFKRMKSMNDKNEKMSLSLKR